MDDVLLNRRPPPLSAATLLKCLSGYLLTTYKRHWYHSFTLCHLLTLIHIPLVAIIQLLQSFPHFFATRWKSNPTFCSQIPQITVGVALMRWAYFVSVTGLQIRPIYQNYLLHNFLILFFVTLGSYSGHWRKFKENLWSWHRRRSR